MTFCDNIQWQPTTDQTLYQAVTLLPNSTYRILRGFHYRTFATGVACRQGTLTPTEPGPVPLGTCICFTCWDQPLFRTCHDFSDSALRTSLGTFSVCACHIRRYHNASNILFSLANQVRRFVHGAINSNASLSYEVSFRLRITDEGSVPEMRIWSILLI